MTPTALIRVYLACSLLCASLLALALSQTPDSVIDDQAGFDRLGLTETFISQGDTRRHLIALQQEKQNSNSETSELDADAKGVSESADGWVEGGHRYAARKADEMTQWVDNFFGNDERDLEQAYSRLRLRTIYDWDDRLDNEIKVRLGARSACHKFPSASIWCFVVRTWTGSTMRGGCG